MTCTFSAEEKARCQASAKEVDKNGDGEIDFQEHLKTSRFAVKQTILYNKSLTAYKYPRLLQRNFSFKSSLELPDFGGCKSNIWEPINSPGIVQTLKLSIMYSYLLQYLWGTAKHGKHVRLGIIFHPMNILFWDIAHFEANPLALRESCKATMPSGVYAHDEKGQWWKCLRRHCRRSDVVLWLIPVILSTLNLRPPQKEKI